MKRTYIYCCYIYIILQILSHQSCQLFLYAIIFKHLSDAFLLFAIQKRDRAHAEELQHAQHESPV